MSEGVQAVQSRLPRWGGDLTKEVVRRALSMKH